jgi:dimethylargininase
MNQREAMMPHPLTHALVRPPGSSFVRAISSQQLAPDVARARAEHAEYCQALRAAGLAVELLPPDERYPDGCFMQDPALVIGNLAVIGRMGAPSRAGEEELAADYMAARWPLARIVPPGTLEGGDVLVLPDRVLVGESARTNAAGIEQLRAILAPLGRPVSAVPVTRYLHLLSAVEYVGHNLLLATEDYAGHPAFAGLEVLVVPRDEVYAVNVLAVGDNVILPAGYPRVAELLRARGFYLFPVPMSQFAAADGGVTCLALVW